MNKSFAISTDATTHAGMELGSKNNRNNLDCTPTRLYVLVLSSILSEQCLQDS